jgi:hypothetical protein
MSVEGRAAYNALGCDGFHLNNDIWISVLYNSNLDTIFQVAQVCKQTNELLQAENKKFWGGFG